MLLKELEVLKQQFLDSVNKNCPGDTGLLKALSTLNVDKKRPLGKFNVSNWSITDLVVAIFVVGIVLHGFFHEVSINICL